MASALVESLYNRKAKGNGSVFLCLLPFSLKEPNIGDAILTNLMERGIAIPDRVPKLVLDELFQSDEMPFELTLEHTHDYLKACLHCFSLELVEGESRGKGKGKLIIVSPPPDTLAIFRKHMGKVMRTMREDFADAFRKLFPPYSEDKWFTRRNVILRACGALMHNFHGDTKWLLSNPILCELLVDVFSGKLKAVPRTAKDDESRVTHRAAIQEMALSIIWAYSHTTHYINKEYRTDLSGFKAEGLLLPKEKWKHKLFFMSFADPLETSKLTEEELEAQVNAVLNTDQPRFLRSFRGVPFPVLAKIIGHPNTNKDLPIHIPSIDLLDPCIRLYDQHHKGGQLNLASVLLSGIYHLNTDDRPFEESWLRFCVRLEIIQLGKCDYVPNPTLCQLLASELNWRAKKKPKPAADINPEEAT